MRSPRLRLLVCMAMLSSPEAGGAQSVDLTAYLAPRPAAGDYRNFLSSSPGSEYEERYDVAAVDDDGSGWRIDWERTADGLSDFDELVRPGVRVRRETLSDSPPPGCRQAIHFRLRGCDLRMRLGEKHSVRARESGMDPPLSFIYYLTQVRGSYRADLFEPIETPYASHASALRVTTVLHRSRARVRYGELFSIVWRGPMLPYSVETTRSWYVEDVGLVAVRTTPGKPEEAGIYTPVFEMYLKDGLVQGVPYP